jgi:DNA sulfur modification protein DndB
MEKSSLSPRARKLFTLSAIYSANNALLDGGETLNMEDATSACATFWDNVGHQIPEWQFVRESKMTSGDVRRDFIHSHAIVLQAMGKMGKQLLNTRKKTWQTSLKKLQTINWSRSNAKTWEGRAMIGGRISKASHNVTLTTNIMKQHLTLQLPPEEERVEQAFLQGDHE